MPAQHGESMKNLVSSLAVLALISAPAMAQDDVYFVPKKKKVVTTVTTVKSSSYESPATSYPQGSLDGDDWYLNRATDVDVDAYNRRGEGADYSDDKRDTVYVVERVEEYYPTDNLIRFHSYFDPWYYSSLAWDAYYGGPYVGPYVSVGFGWGGPWWRVGVWAGPVAWRYDYWRRPYYWGGYHYGPRWGYGYAWHRPYGHYHGWRYNWAHRNSDGSWGYQNRGGRGYASGGSGRYGGGNGGRGGRMW